MWFSWEVESGGRNSMGMLHLTPGLSHSKSSGKHGGVSHIGETPCDGSEGELEEEEEV